MGRSLVISGLGGWGGHLGDRASALLDGQLGVEESERAWAHVHACHACRDQVEREGWLKRRLAGLTYDPTAAAAPDGLKGTLLGAPGDVFFPLGLEHRQGGGYTQRTAVPSPRRALALAALGGGALGAAVMGVVALAAGPASAPTQPVPVAAVGSAVATPLVPVAHHRLLP